MTRPDLPAATRIDGRSLRLTSLDKVMYPTSGTTKQEVLAYYAAVAPYFVLHAAMRPATRKRFVDGVGYAGTPGKVFFEKNLGNGAPSWIARRSMKHSDRVVTYPLINDASTLVWCAQMGALELHVPQWKFDGDDPVNPDRLVLDLDPGPGADLESCVEVALLCKDILDDVGLDSVPVTSGSKGLHLYARLDGEQTSEQASQFAHTLARALEADHPDLIVSDMKKSLRGGKVLLDWSQNNAAKTTVAPYSLRGTPTPQVACPREWAEIVPGLRHLEMYEVIERLERIGDPMAGLDGGQPPDVEGSDVEAPVVVAAAPEAPRRRGPLRPMQASVGRIGQVRGDGWAYEVKWDGYRAMAAVRDGSVVLTSRNGIDLTKSYPELQEIAELAAHDCVLDGEIVALDASGRPSFERLQERPSSSRIRVQMMLFDVLDIDGESLLERDYAARRTALEELVADGKHTHVPPPLDGTADEALQRSADLELEGIVAKRLDSPYLPGVRTTAWLKLKHQQTQEVVVVGWRPGQGNRSATLGSLLLAVPDGEEMVYAGKVGSGLSDRVLAETLKKLAKIERRTPQATGVPPADARGARWVSPVYVAEVSYAEWTSSGRLRQPVWKGWRPDKTPAQVVRE
ncbi:non-homologous end-joining DNA ligase [Cumulibacter manganitolerans]|uniref:non-homologous end-joining DNA ligase n=1 Tax=Cumulibacter manganitolerans TaxID=1884992 RepID=UPI001296D1AF|nr:non-homologous end-joining DNA ligase [Cumulibacter manganitolerans]